MRADLVHVAQARVGRTLNGKWHLDRLIDVGGMAAVYAATHRNGKQVAVKVLHPSFAAGDDVRDRFLREGYVANKVGHPGAVAVLDDDSTEQGQVFLVMELLEGESLRALLLRSGGTLPVLDVLGIADQVLDVLAAAHEKQIIHRDIKPANLFVTRERQLKVLDFGLARLRDGTHHAATATGVVIGTSTYMPPEQALGKTSLVDGRTDIYAVGAVMFKALSGENIHPTAAGSKALLAAMFEPAPSLFTVAPRLPKPVCDVVDKALAFEMDGRWPDARTMQRAVRAAQARVKQDVLMRGDEPTVTSFDIPRRPAPDEHSMVDVSVSYEPDVDDTLTDDTRVDIRPRGATPTPVPPPPEPDENGGEKV